MFSFANWRSELLLQMEGENMWAQHNAFMQPKASLRVLFIFRLPQWHPYRCIWWSLCCLDCKSVKGCVLLFFFFIWSPKAARNAFIQNGKCHKMAGIKGKLRELQKASVKVEGGVKNRLKVHNKGSGVRIQCKGNLRTMGPGNLMSTAGS